VSHWYPPGNLDCELVASSGYQTLLLHTIEDTTEEIDQMVYKLYGLTEEEIRTLDEQTSTAVTTKPILESTPPTELTGEFIIS
jgi:hypothetical protein